MRVLVSFSSLTCNQLEEIAGYLCSYFFPILCIHSHYVYTLSGKYKFLKRLPSVGFLISSFLRSRSCRVSMERLRAREAVRPGGEEALSVHGDSVDLDFIPSPVLSGRYSAKSNRDDRHVLLFLTHEAHVYRAPAMQGAILDLAQKEKQTGPSATRAGTAVAHGQDSRPGALRRGRWEPVPGASPAQSGTGLRQEEHGSQNPGFSCCRWRAVFSVDGHNEPLGNFACG